MHKTIRFTDSEHAADLPGIRLLWPIIDRTGNIVTCSIHRADPVATFTRTGYKRWPDEVLMSANFGSALPENLRHPVTPVPAACHA